ncbi:hypothetical protein NIES2100_43820 [Calothrix sp. NIES-2100]|nr:hypothetical protein NIES2100_43820 [Calothrix sp. NIES-2100]
MLHQPHKYSEINFGTPIARHLRESKLGCLGHKAFQVSTALAAPTTLINKVSLLFASPTPVVSFFGFDYFSSTYYLL